MIAAHPHAPTVAPLPPRVLTYREHQFVKVFVYLAKLAEQGGKRREIAALLGLSANSPYLRSLLDQMVQLRFLTEVKCVAEPRAPYRYFTPAEAFQRSYVQ